mgnify:CR=1 FL=1
MFVPFADFLNHKNVQATFDIYVKEDIDLPAQHENETQRDTVISNWSLLDDYFLFSDELTWDDDPPEFDTLEEKYATIRKYSDFKFATTTMSESYKAGEEVFISYGKLSN